MNIVKFRFYGSLCGTLDVDNLIDIDVSACLKKEQNLLMITWSELSNLVKKFPLFLTKKPCKKLLSIFLTVSYNLRILPSFLSPLPRKVLVKVFCSLFLPGKHKALNVEVAQLNKSLLGLLLVCQHFLLMFFDSQAFNYCLIAQRECIHCRC